MKNINHWNNITKNAIFVVPAVLVEHSFFIVLVIQLAIRITEKIFVENPHPLNDISKWGNYVDIKRKRWRRSRCPYPDHWYCSTKSNAMSVLSMCMSYSIQKTKTNNQIIFVRLAVRKRFSAFFRWWSYGL